MLREKVKRVNLVTARWRSSIRNAPPLISPENSGWNLVDENYQINWFEGDIVPPAVDGIIIPEDNELSTDSNTDSDDLSDESNDDSSGE